MLNANVNKIKGVLELLLDSSERINQLKPEKYWYPLSMATYGVEEILEALDSMCGFKTTMWEKTRSFENNFSQAVKSKNAIMVNSGSSADLLLSYLLCNPVSQLVEKKGEVLIPALTWPTHVWSIMSAGLKVKLVDIDRDTLNISIQDLERKGQQRRNQECKGERRGKDTIPSWNDVERKEL